jgi:hypothetical protein
MAIEITEVVEVLFYCAIINYLYNLKYFFNI